MAGRHHRDHPADQGRAHRPPLVPGVAERRPVRAQRHPPLRAVLRRGGRQRPPRPFQASPSRPDDLTTRAREVLDLLADGASNQQIARSLGISLKTVQNHVSVSSTSSRPPTVPTPPSAPGAFHRTHGAEHTADAPAAPGDATSMTAAPVAGSTQSPCLPNQQPSQTPVAGTSTPEPGNLRAIHRRTLQTCLGKYSEVSRSEILPNICTSPRSGASTDSKGRSASSGRARPPGDSAVRPCHGGRAHLTAGSPDAASGSC